MNIFSRMKPKKNPKSPAQKTASKIKKRYSKGYVKTPTKVQRAKRALLEVTKGLALHKAAEKYDLSYSYLQRRASGSVPITARQGPSPFLSNEEENAHEMAMRGMGLRPADVMKLVQNFVNREKRKTPFKNNRPGYTWYYGFISRHAQKIQMRKETLLETSRSKVTHESMDKWFTDYRPFYPREICLIKAIEYGILMKLGLQWGVNQER